MGSFVETFERIIAELETLVFGKGIKGKKAKEKFLSRDSVSVKDLPDYQNSLIFKGEIEYFKAQQHGKIKEKKA